MQRTRSMFAIVASATLALSLAACGNDAETPEANTPAVEQPIVPTEDPGTDNTQPISPDTKYVSFIDMDDDAYKVRLTVLTSDVLRPQSGMVMGGMNLDSCEYDSQKDAVVAYTLSLNNTSTAQVPVDYTLNWDIDRAGLPGDADTSRVRIKTGFYLGGESKCYDEFSSQTGGQFGANAELGPNAVLDVQGFFILQNFFTAKYPNGDFGSVKTARIVVNQIVADNSARLGFSEKDLGSMEKLNLNDYEHRFGAKLVAKQQVGTA